MISFVETPRIHITCEVYDFMFVCNDQHGAHEQPLKFKIVNNKGRAVRKGTIRGHIIQLRLSHLKEGEYHLSVSNEDDFCVRLQFVKRNSLNGQCTPLVF